MVHIGHIKHLEEAKNNCDILVVSITSDQFVTKHPLGTYHSISQRAHFLLTLRTVDYVYIDDHKEAVDVLQNLKPNYYFKGIDYAECTSTDLSLKREMDICKETGGSVVFTQSDKHSSSYLLNHYVDDRRILISKYLRKHQISNDPDYLDSIFIKLATSSILLLGEAIQDVYIYGRLTGISSKFTAPSFLQSHKKTMMGGIHVLIPLLSCHVKQVQTLSPLNYVKESEYATFSNVDLLEQEFPIVEKIRFISVLKKERLFEAVNITPFKKFDVMMTVERMINEQNYSAILLYDFGHGFFDNPNFVKNKRNHFYALNVQANSTNYPFNVVNKYDYYDLVTLDERELRLSLHDQNSPIEVLIEIFIQRSRMKSDAYFFFTVGEKGAWCYFKGELIHCPALVSSVVDSTGSGDIFHAIATIFIVSKIDIGTSLFFANLYAGLYAQIEGHDGTLSREDIIRAISAMQ